MFLSYWIVAKELTPYPRILGAFVFFSYVCAGRKREVKEDILLSWLKLEQIISYLP